MQRDSVLLFCSAAMLIVSARSQAADPDWASMPYTLHSAYQSVDANGAGTFPLNDPVKMRGVIINWPHTLLDATPGSDPFMGGQWQRHIQAVDLPDTPDDDNDFGGTACWMGQNIGKIMGNHPAGSYTAAEWLAELHRLDHDPATGRWFRPGDLVEVRARAPGLFHNGKTNINEQHSKDLQADFDVVLLQADFGLPAPQVITLSDVKDAADSFIFDPTRLTGAEHYQGILAQVNNVSFVSTANWGPAGDLVIQDGTGRTLPVKLGLGKGFSRYGPPSPPFDIMGIFDQEDPIGNDGYKDGYRLWAMDYDGSDFVLLLYARADFDRDADVDQDDLGYLQTCSTGPGITQTESRCGNADLDGDGDVDQSDFGVFQRCISGLDTLADPACAE